MELNIFNTDLDRIAIIDTFSSFRYLTKFYDVGECELHLPFSIEALEVLAIDNIIYIDDRNSFIIHTREISRDGEGAETIVIYGKSLINILSWRINYKQVSIKEQSANEIVKALVNSNIISPTDTKRKIKNLTIGELIEAPLISKQNTYGNLLDVLLNITSTTDISFYLSLDRINKKLQLRSFKGADRSINQSEISYCIFSQEFENVEEQEYSNSLDNLRNVALVGGEGQGKDRKIIEIGNASGLNRRELFVDADDLTSTYTEEDGTEKTLTEEEYMELLKQRGNEKLSECEISESFNSNISLKSNLEYNKDFFLGDVVTVMNKKWNLTMNTKITEVEEVWEGSRTVSVTFGESMPTLIDKIKINIK